MIPSRKKSDCVRGHLTMLALCMLVVGILSASGSVTSSVFAEEQDARGKTAVSHCVKIRLLADRRLEEPIRAIIKEYSRRSGTDVSLKFLPFAQVESLVAKNQAECDVAASLAAKKNGKTPLSALEGAKRVAWKHPSGEPVWAAVIGTHSRAGELLRFLGGPTAHRLWSESEAGFTITSGRSHAEAFDWVVKNRVKHTYPLSAIRILRELGGIRKGICIDIGCGTGNLDVEIAKRSQFTITGLDIDPDMKPLFDKRVREAGLQDRIHFIAGDAQKLPFKDNYADVIVSRGTLTFIPDIGKCLKEVDRVLKPTGVAFLGGRYLYTPHEDRITTEKLRRIVAATGLVGAKVVDMRGQWVKIVGSKAPKAARQFQLGPQMLANRFIADYAIVDGTCLLICPVEGAAAQALQRGFVEMTDLEITALYPSEKDAEKATKRVEQSDLGKRITCKVGTLENLPFAETSFDLVAGVGPILIWGDREKKMRELYRVLRLGGVALVGGRYVGMPAFRKVSSEDLRNSAAKTGIRAIRVMDDGGQWVEVRKGAQERGLRR